MVPSRPVSIRAAAMPIVPPSPPQTASVRQRMPATVSRQISLSASAISAATPQAGRNRLPKCQTASSGSTGRFAPGEGKRCDESAILDASRGDERAAKARAMHGSGRNFIIAAMSVFALGLNPPSAPLDLRGRFAFTLEQLAPTLLRFQDQVGAPQRRRATAAEAA